MFMNQELYQVADSLYALYICVVSRPMVGGGGDMVFSIYP